MDELSEHYRVLGLSPGATPAAIKQAYRDLVKVWHPDRFLHDDRLRVMAQEKLKEINGAYEILCAHEFNPTAEPAADPEPQASAEAPLPRRGKMVQLGAAILGVLLLAGAVLFFLKASPKASQKNSPPAAVVILPTTNSPHALSFDGGLGQLNIATTGALSGTFTVELWVLTRKAKTGGTILSSRSPEEWGIDIKFRQGNRFHADLGDGKRWVARNANATFAYQPDTWYHLAYVVKADEYIVYVNGANMSQHAIYPPGDPLLYDATHQLAFGIDRMNEDQFAGNLAEVRIWNTLRTQAQIVAGMHAKLIGEQPGLMGYWRFEEGTGTTTADGSGHGFTGTLSGDISWSSRPPPATY